MLTKFKLQGGARIADVALQILAAKHLWRANLPALN